MSKADDDGTRSLTRREALKSVAGVPAGALAPKAEPAGNDSPEGDLARLRALMAAFTAAQEKAWHVREELEEALFAARGESGMGPGPGAPLKAGELSCGKPDIDDGLDTALEPSERERIQAREAVIAAPARTLAAVAAKLRWVAQEYTSWFDEDDEDEVEARAGQRVLADLEALTGV